MSDSQWDKVIRICTVVMAVCTVVSTAIIIWQQATGVPASWFTYVAAFFAGFGCGYGVRYLMTRVRAGEASREPDVQPDWFSGLDAAQLRAIARLYHADGYVEAPGDDTTMKRLEALKWTKGGSAWPVAGKNAREDGTCEWYLNEGPRSVIAANLKDFEAELESKAGER